MKKEPRIIIAERRIKYFGLMLIFLMIAFIGLAMIRRDCQGDSGSLVECFKGMLCFLFGIISLPIWVWKVFIRLSSVVFNHEGVVIKLSNKNIYNIPWSEISRIGLQDVSAEVTKIGKIILRMALVPGARAERIISDTEFLVLVFKNRRKYQFSFRRSDYSLFLPTEKLRDYKGPLKGHLYIRLPFNLGNKRIENLADEFQKKLSITLEKFPNLLKSKDNRSQRAGLTE